MGRVDQPTWSYPARSINELAVHVGSGVTPTGGSEVYRTEGVLFIRSQNVHFDGLRLDDAAFIDDATHASMSRSEVQPHDVLLNITGASIGRCCPVPASLGKANVNQHVCAIRLPVASKHDATFLSAVLASHIGQAQIDQLNAGSNREGLNYQQIRAFLVPWPEVPIRTAVAQILDTLEEAIRKTEQIIAKLKQVKQGLLHDLLTRGIDENGELRDPIRHPEQFKDSPLGRIPCDWIATTLRNAAELSSGTTPARSQARYWSGGTIPWVKTGEVNFNAITTTQEAVTEVALSETPLRLYSPGTVLVAMYGQGATRGRSAILSVAATTNQACAAIQTETTKLMPQFLFDYLKARYENLRGLGHGSHQTNLSATLLGDSALILPNLKEQKRIVDVLEAHDLRTQHEEAHLHKLGLLKVGLAEDLLTGRVRVRHDGESVHNAQPTKQLGLAL